MYGYSTGWRPRPRKPFYLKQVAISGMRDNLDPSTATQDKAQLLRNIYPVLPGQGGGLTGRPGFAAISTNLGGVAGSRGQRSFQLTKSDGTEWTLVFSGGKVFVVNWGARTVTDVTAGLPVALSATAHIGITEFDDGVYFHDGVSKPIYGTVNSGTGVWTFTLVANAPVLFGEPVEYYGKVTGIRADDRTVIVWSEELDAMNGYETFPYNNAWSLIQGGKGRLMRLEATNEGLYYWREDGISMVVGATSDEYTTPAVEDSISPEVGTLSPWAFAKAGVGSIFFLDQLGRPQMVRRGVGLVEPGIWEDAFETTRSLPRSMLPEAVGAYWPHLDMVLLGISTREAQRPDAVLGFRGSTGAFATVWKTRAGNATFTSLDIVKNADGVEVLMHTNDSSGVFDWGDPEAGDTWDDAGTAIEHIFVGGALGYSQNVQLQFDRVDFSLRLDGELTDMRFAYTVPKGTVSEVGITEQGGAALWDEVQWDQFVWAGDTAEEHLPIGFYDEGRWIQIRLRHSGLGERFGLLGYTVETFAIGAIPSAR